MTDEHRLAYRVTDSGILIAACCYHHGTQSLPRPGRSTAGRARNNRGGRRIGCGRRRG
ncbi:hypothetical protein [Actinomyces mediterranea]|uniref:hypothetical protein n=1 Tax=Actinomyces mediterranea TaxID=1871028 RepID=UPI0038B33E4F